MLESLTSKYDKLLSFRHEEVIILKLEAVLQSAHQRSVYLDLCVIVVKISSLYFVVSIVS